jgi:hypothetical protein
MRRAGKVSSAYQERISARRSRMDAGAHPKKLSYSEFPDGIGMFDRWQSGSGKIAWQAPILAAHGLGQGLKVQDEHRTRPRFARPPTRRRFLASIPVSPAASSPGASTSRPYCSSSRPLSAVWQNMGSLPGGTSLGLMAVCHRTVIGDRSSPPHASFSSSATPNPRGMIRNCRTTRAR